MNKIENLNREGSSCSDAEERMNNIIFGKQKLHTSAYPSSRRSARDSDRGKKIFKEDQEKHYKEAPTPGSPPPDKAKDAMEVAKEGEVFQVGDMPQA